MLKIGFSVAEVGLTLLKVVPQCWGTHITSNTYTEKPHTYMLVTFSLMIVHPYNYPKSIFLVSKLTHSSLKKVV